MIILAGDTPLPPKQEHRQLRPCCCCWEQGAEPRAECLPLSEESATRVFDVLQLKETRPHQQRLDVLLIYGQVTIVGKVDQSLKSTKQGGEKCQNLLTINLTGYYGEKHVFWRHSGRGEAKACRGLSVLLGILDVTWDPSPA